MGKKIFEIICGTYEEYLLGYIYNYKFTEFNQSFAAHDHSGSIRSVAFCDQYLASGGTDDRIIIYDLKTRKEHCMLTHHDSTVNCIQFTPNHSHIISGSADGRLAIVRIGNWQLEKIWDKPHKGSAVLDIAVHPSGKLALTLGGDGTLCTWNLVKGRQAFVVNLNSKCKEAKRLERIIWCEDAVRFVIYGGKYTEIWSIETGGPLQQIEHAEKVVSCIWIDEDHLLIGFENGDLCKFQISTNDRNITHAHETRVKVISSYKQWFVSCSSNGEIKIWNHALQETYKHNTGCRITCLCIVPFLQLKAVNQENESEPLEVVNETPKKRESAVVVIEEDNDNIYTENRIQRKKSKVRSTSNTLNKNENPMTDISEHKGKSKKRKRKS